MIMECDHDKKWYQDLAKEAYTVLYTLLYMFSHPATSCYGILCSCRDEQKK